MKLSLKEDYEDADIAVFEPMQKGKRIAPLEVKGRKKVKQHRPRHGNSDEDELEQDERS